ncbi:MAG TPA: ABC transporter permease [Thermoanaerobaculia bacterium]|nr:ABC transporter permease [Thermoanaerobaculia bacterium]
MHKLALRNLLRNKLRTMLTVASLMFALLLLSLLMAFLDLLGSTSGASDNRVIVRSAISLATLLPESYWHQVESLPHVQAVTPLNWFHGVYKDERPENFFPRFAADPATVFKVYPELRISPEEQQAWAADRRGFVAGKALATKYGWRLGDSIFIKGDIYPMDVNLVLRGIFTRPGNADQEKVLYFHRQYLEEGIGKRGLIGTYVVRIDSPASEVAVRKAAEAKFENSDFQVRAETEKAFQLSFAEMMGNVKLLFTAIGLAAVISIFFITANTMAMAARERTAEVGVLKTLGFGRGQLLRLVLGESLAVGVLGAVLGCGLCALLLPKVGAALASFMPMFGTLRMSGGNWATGLGIGVAGGLLSGVGPAFAAARLRIVDAVRRVA